MLFSSIKKAFSAFTAKPFLFVWGSLMYLFMLLIFLLATFGLVLIYFMAASTLSYDITFELAVESVPNMLAVLAIALFFVYFMGGMNAALAKTYNDAVNGVKTNFLDFYYYGLSRASIMFGILMMRCLVSILVIAPVGAIYYFFLMDYEYMDYILYAYAVGMTFLIHMLFTPAFISASLGSIPFDAFRAAFATIRNKHVFFVGLYIVFAFVWLLNFIPLIQLVTLFFLYPVMYSALIIFVENNSTPVPRQR